MADKKENKFAQNGSATVFQELKSSEQGLSANEAHERLKKYGLNVIKKGKKENQWKAFLRHFSSTMAILLWAAGIIAMISNNVELGIAMWMVNIINGLFSY